MQFSIYSELQWWPGKEPAQVYAEVLEQIENADRVGFDTYSAIEHFFFPKFSASPDPIALFTAAAQRTKRINFRTLVHVLPYHNPMVLASADRERRHPHRRPLRVRRRPRARLDPLARGDRLLARWSSATTSRSRSSSRRSSPSGEPIDYDGKFFQIHDARVVPPPTRKFRVFTGGTSDKTYVLAGTKGWGVVVPPLLPYEALREQLDLYRAPAPSTATSRHRLDPRVLPRRGPRHGGPRGRGRHQGLPRRQCVTARGASEAAGRRPQRRGVRLLHRRHPRGARRDRPTTR